jgi:hypothetical protein
VATVIVTRSGNKLVPIRSVLSIYAVYGRILGAPVIWKFGWMLVACPLESESWKLHGLQRCQWP